jgi:hypothetical protein
MCIRDSPVRVYSGTGILVDEGFEGHLRNINTGKQFYTPISTGWLITPVANATEYFESRTWPELKDAFGILSSMSRSSGWADENLGPLESRQSIQASAMAALSSLESWLGKTDAQKDLDIFHNNKIELPGIDPRDISPLRIDGHSLSFSYSPARDRMEIRSDLPQGRILIELGPISGGEFKVQAETILWSGTRVELEINEGTYSLHGNFAGFGVNEGSSMPKQPTESILEVLSSPYMISPQIPLETLFRPSPYISSDRITVDDEIEVRASVVLFEEDAVEWMDRINGLEMDDIGTMLRRMVMESDNEGITIGVRVSFSSSGLPDLVRMAVFESLTGEDLMRLDRTGSVDQLLLNLLTNTRMVIPDLAGEELVFIETTPSWTLHVPVTGPTGDIVTAVHLSQLGQLSFSYFIGSINENDSDTWTVEEGETPSPLW